MGVTIPWIPDISVGEIALSSPRTFTIFCNSFHYNIWLLEWTGPLGLGSVEKLTTRYRQKHIVMNLRTLNNVDYQRGIENGKLGDIKIVTWNIITLFEADIIKIIIVEVKRNNLPIIALQKIRWTGCGRVKLNDTTLFYSRGSSDKHKFSVGFMIS